MLLLSETHALCGGDDWWEFVAPQKGSGCPGQCRFQVLVGPRLPMEVGSEQDRKRRSGSPQLTSRGRRPLCWQTRAWATCFLREAKVVRETWKLLGHLRLELVVGVGDPSVWGQGVNTEEIKKDRFLLGAS